MKNGKEYLYDPELYRVPIAYSDPVPKKELMDAIRNGDIVSVEKSLKRISADFQDDEGNTPLTLAIQKGNDKIAQLLIDSAINVGTSNSQDSTAWDIALAKGNTKIFEMLLLTSHGNVKDKEGTPYLIHAVATGNLDITKLLLKYGADINSVTTDGYNSLMMSLGATNKEILKFVLEQKPSLDQQSKSGFTALICAVITGDIEAVKILIEAGASLDVQDQQNNTALLKALKDGHIEIAKLLIERGANVNLKNNEGDTPLLIATNKGIKNIVNLLIQEGAEIDAQDNDGNTPLIKASINAFSIPEEGTPLDVQDNEDNTALLQSLKDGYIEIMKLLIESGANLNLKSNDGFTPLLSAADTGTKDIVDLLLKKGADINAQNNDSHTPLIRAAAFGNLEAAKILIDAGAALDLQSSIGSTALLHALQDGHIEIAKLLITSGANVNLKDNMGYSALLVAAGTGSKDIMDLLIQKGADINAADNDGHTPLIAAAAFGSLEAAKILIDAGASLDFQSSIGNTALHQALKNGHTEIAKLLITSGANVNLRNNTGDTPLIIAADLDQDDIVESLISYKADTSIKNKQGFNFFDQLKPVNYSHKLFEQAFMVFGTFDTFFDVSYLNYGDGTTESTAGRSFGNFVEVVKRAFEGQKIPHKLEAVLEKMQKAIDAGTKNIYESQSAFSTGHLHHSAWLIAQQKEGIIIEANKGSGCNYKPGIKIAKQDKFTEEDYLNFIKGIKDLNNKGSDEYESFINNLLPYSINPKDWAYIPKAYQVGGRCLWVSAKVAAEVLLALEELKDKGKDITVEALVDAIEKNKNVYQEIFRKVKDFYFGEVLKVGKANESKYDQENAIKFFTYLALTKQITSKEGMGEIYFEPKAIEALKTLGLSRESINLHLKKAYRESLPNNPTIKYSYKEGILKFVQKHFTHDSEEFKAATSNEEWHHSLDIQGELSGDIVNA